MLFKPIPYKKVIGYALALFICLRQNCQYLQFCNIIPDYIMTRVAQAYNKIEYFPKENNSKEYDGYPKQLLLYWLTLKPIEKQWYNQ